MKFLIDMPLSPALAPWLKRRSHEAIHASALGMEKAPDAELLSLAHVEDWIVITADHDFPRLLALTEADGPATILFRGGNYNEAEMRELLERVLGTVQVEDLSRSITVVDRFRIRRTRLPIRTKKKQKKR